MRGAAGAAASRRPLPARAAAATGGRAAPADDVPLPKRAVVKRSGSDCRSRPAGAGRNVHVPMRDDTTVGFEESPKFAEVGDVCGDLLRKYGAGLEFAAGDLADDNGNGADEFVTRLRRYLDWDTAARNANTAPARCVERRVIARKSESSSTDSHNSEYYKEEDALRSTDSESQSSISPESSDEMMTSLESGIKTVIYESANSRETKSMNPVESETNKNGGKKSKCNIT